MRIPKTPTSLGIVQPPKTDVRAVTAEPYGAMPWGAPSTEPSLGPGTMRLGQRENHHGTRTRLLFDE